MNEFFELYGRWVWLGVSLLSAVLVDWGVTRLVMEFVRPASSAAFWAGRAGKLVAVLAWVAFFNSYWYPTYLAAPSMGDAPVELPDAIKWGETGLLLSMLVLAGLTLPRGSRARGEVDA